MIANAHEVVRAFVRRVLRTGGCLVVQVGGEPRSADEHLPLIFEWSVLEEALACLQDGTTRAIHRGRPLIFAVASERSESQIPADREAIWEALLNARAVHLERTRPGWHSSSGLRAIQAREGSVLVTLGGGAGVENLTQRYVARRRAVIPLDFPLEGFFGDGTIRGEGLARLALADPSRFFRLRHAGSEAARLREISTKGGTARAEDVADRLIALVCDLTPPTVFFVRLMDRTHADHPGVDAFFRNVVEPVIRSAGYRRHEVGKDDPTRAFVNHEVFEELYYSDVAVVDLTGERPNCLIELGYALRGEGRVVVTARTGTHLAFDVRTLPCYFWSPDGSDQVRRREFQAFWQRQVKQQPLVWPAAPF